MDERKRKILEKIDDLNQIRASIKHDFKSFEEKKTEYSNKKYEKLKKKYVQRLEKIRKKIHKLEDELNDFGE